MTNPLRRVFAFDRRELPVALLLFSFFFLCMAVFQIVRALKKTEFLEFYGNRGAEMELFTRRGAFTNMFVQRLAKGVGILGALLFAAWEIAPRWLSPLTMLVAAGMIAASIFAGSRFAARSAPQEAPGSALVAQA